MTNSLIIFSAKYLIYILIAVGAVWFFTLTREQQKKLLYYAVPSFILIFIASRIAGHFYFDPRPFVAGHFTPLIPHAPDNGFPSDHALLASAIAACAWPFGKKFSALAWIFYILIGIARVAAGIHHTIDIIGAAVISIAIAIIVYYAMRKKLENNS